MNIKYISNLQEYRVIYTLISNSKSNITRSLVAKVSHNVEKLASHLHSSLSRHSNGGREDVSPLHSPSVVRKA